MGCFVASLTIRAHGSESTSAVPSASTDVSEIRLTDLGPKELKALGASIVECYGQINSLSERQIKGLTQKQLLGLFKHQSADPSETITNNILLNRMLKADKSNDFRQYRKSTPYFYKKVAITLIELFLSNKDKLKTQQKSKMQMAVFAGKFISVLTVVGVVHDVGVFAHRSLCCKTAKESE